MFSDDQRDRKHERRRASADQPSEELAGRIDGLALGVGRIRGDGLQLPKDHGPSAALDVENTLGAVADGRKSWRCEEGRVNHESRPPPILQLRTGQRLIPVSAIIVMHGMFIFVATVPCRPLS
jgi:hypothetical protein